MGNKYTQSERSENRSIRQTDSLRHAHVYRVSLRIVSDSLSRLFKRSCVLVQLINLLLLLCLLRFVSKREPLFCLNAIFVLRRTVYRTLYFLYSAIYLLLFYNLSIFHVCYVILHTTNAGDIDEAFFVCLRAYLVFRDSDMVTCSTYKSGKTIFRQVVSQTFLLLSGDLLILYLVLFCPYIRQLFMFSHIPYANRNYDFYHKLFHQLTKKDVLTSRILKDIIQCCNFHTTHTKRCFYVLIHQSIFYVVYFLIKKRERILYLYIPCGFCFFIYKK